MEILKSLSSPAGRVIRTIAGIALIVVGLFVIQGTGGLILGVIGLVPLAAGVFDVCLLAPLFKAPIEGPKIRAM